MERGLIDKFYLLQQAVATTKKQYLFQIKAYVVLPEHLHMIWSLPAGDDNYSLRLKLIKTLFSKAVAQEGVVIAKSLQDWQYSSFNHYVKTGKLSPTWRSYINENKSGCNFGE